MLGRVTNKVYSKVFSKVDVNKVAQEVRYAQRAARQTITKRKETIADKLAKFIVENLYTSKYAKNLANSKKPSITDRIFARLFKNVDKEQLISRVRKVQPASGDTPTAKSVLNDIVG